MCDNWRSSEMPHSQFADMEKLFFALSDRTRMRLLTYIAHGEASVGFLANAVGQSQPKISRHLAYLRNMGIVTTRRDGKWVYYAIDQAMPACMIRVLSEVVNVLTDDQPAPVHEITPTSLPSAHEPDHTYVDESDDWRPAEMDIFLL
jgi:DNA-binding transcriptional ArsR family regulator